MQLSLIVPMFNEEAVAKISHKRIKYALKNYKKCYEIIFCDDGSIDKTKLILQDLAKTDPHTKMVSYKVNRGVGYAYRQGLKIAKGKNIIFMDADLAINPNIITKFETQLNSSDLVIASRYKGISPDYPLGRKLASYIYYFINKFIFRLDIRDTQSGFFAIKKEVLKRIETFSDGFDIYIEMFYKLKKRGIRIEEIPAKFIHRKGGSFSVLKDGPKLLFDTLTLYLKLNKLTK